MSDVYSKRRERVLQGMREAGISQLIVTDPLSIDYLSGVYIQPYERLLALILYEDREALFIFNRLFNPQKHPLRELWISDTDDAAASLAGQLIPSGKLGIDKEMTARYLIPALERLPEIQPVLASRLVDDVRAVKDADEIEKMRRSSQINDEVILSASRHAKVGMTERELRDFILAEYTRCGAEGPSFDTIVSFGANAADPHHEVDDSVLREGDVCLIDMGCIWKGYCSDMTRSFFCGFATKEQKKVYEIVREANEIAESMAAPGVALRDLDAAARQHIEKAGYGEYFTHRLGHFIGRSEHEAGDVSATSDIIAKPGMIFSIEPGIYLPDHFGVRIEDLILITEDGSEVLNKVSKDLTILNRA